MKRSHFLLIGTFILCLMPILGTAFDAGNTTRQTVHLQTEQQTRHW